MADSNDPLAQLLADDVRIIDRGRLAEFLRPYVRFDKITKEVNVLRDYISIPSNEAKIEVALIASKAKSLILDEPEGLSPIEIIKLEVMPEGSVKSSLKKLYDTHKIKKGPTGRYSLPDYRIEEIISKLSPKG